MSFENVHNTIERMIDEETVPGASFSFINGMKVNGFVQGYKSIKPQKTKLLPNQLYDIASLTKVVGTLPVIMQLIEQEKINLNDSITQFLPEWKFPQVTIRHLLTHTSDIEGYIPNRNQMNKGQLRAALLNLHIGEHFGKKMIYQDANYIFLGWIAGVITGLPIQPLIKEMVLLPLALNDSTFHPEPQKTVPTTFDEKTKTNLVGIVHDPKAEILGSSCGSAGLFSTQRDLEKYIQWMLQLTFPGKVYTNEMFDAMYKDQTPMNDGSRSFGWRLDEYHGHPFIWQSGYTGMVMVIVREKRSGFVFLSNRVHPQVSQKFMQERNLMIDQYLEELFK
ncbi:serine hydrolase domain-containing protein [Fructilactobacillus vespulae]|uniref:serine hydrolase domain-containing protein n=1 Tax=Fructilactobacillus vespulae TaxID=1249630 RepID=UPI0039B6980E